MAITSQDFKGTAQEPTRFSQEAGGEALYNKVKQSILEELKYNNIPHTKKEDVIRSGGILLGTRLPILIISHPTCKYFSVGIYVSEQTVHFILLGDSPEIMKMRYRQNGYGGGLLGAFNKPDQFKIEQELHWRQDVLDCFNNNIQR